MKRGHGILLIAGLLLGIIILFFGLYGLGINGYAVYDGNVGAGKSFVAGNSIFEDIKGFFGGGDFCTAVLKNN